MNSITTATLLKIALMAAVLFAAGCQYVDLSLLSPTNVASEPRGPRPVAVLSVAPSADAFDAALTMFGLANSKSKTKPLEKRFPGIDVERPAGALLFLADDGHADPLMYVPINDYEKFLSGLNKKFRMNRAIATKITIRRQEFVMMQLDDYAVFGYSADAIKRGSDVEGWLDKFASSSDIAFNWIGTKKRSDLKKLLTTVKHSFGSSAANILAKAETVVVDIKSDDDQQIQLEARIHVGQENKDKLNSQLVKLVADESSITANIASESQPDFLVSLQPEASRASFKQIQLALSDFAKSQAALSKKRKPKRADVQQSDKALSQFTSLLNKNSGSNSQCPPRRRRSGG